MEDHKLALLKVSGDAIRRRSTPYRPNQVMSQLIGRSLHREIISISRQLALVADPCFVFYALIMFKTGKITHPIILQILLNDWSAA